MSDQLFTFETGDNPKDEVLDASESRGSEQSAAAPELTDAPDGPSESVVPDTADDHGEGDSPVNVETDLAGHADLGEAREANDRPTGEPRVGVLTNRRNLLEFLSRRQIVPAESISKYYRDLLELAPGQIPLVSTPISLELVRAVTEGDQVFPVFLELEHATELTPRRSVALSEVKAIHFRTEVELTEHTARKYANVPDGPPLTVSPGLFSGGSQTLSAIRSAKMRDRNKRAERLSWASAWSGAVLTSVRALEEHADADSVTVVERMLSGRPWGRTKLAPHLGVLRQMRDGKPPSTGKDEDTAIFAEALSRMVNEGPPGDTVGFVDSLVESTPVDDRTRRAFLKMKAILAGDIEFEPFRPTGSPVIKGLLVALMRATPDRLQPWSADVASADGISTVTAAVLIGASSGRHLLDVTLRPESLDGYLAHLELEAQEGAVPATVSTLQSQRSTQSRRIEHRITLGSGPEIVLAEPAVVPLVELLDRAEFNAELTRELVQIAVRRGWEQAVKIDRRGLRAELEKLSEEEPVADSVRRLLKSEQ